MPQQKFELQNNTSAAMEVWVEVNPDRYILQPKDEILVEADHAPPEHPEREGFFVQINDDCVQIYPNGGLPSGVWINGMPAKPDHKTKI